MVNPTRLSQVYWLRTDENGRPEIVPLQVQDVFYGNRGSSSGHLDVVVRTVVDGTEKHFVLEEDVFPTYASADLERDVRQIFEYPS